MNNNILLKKNPLFDKEFLNKLFSFRHRETFARITLLTINEQPLEQIEGKITDGTINIDGSSAVRRTCNLNMVAENVNINEFYWGLKNKFKLEVGVRNNIDPIYPNIIWFPQGIFVITQFNTSQTTNQWSIKIQGKDKMCLLNGDLSGQLPPTDFAQEQYTDLTTGEITLKQLPIKTIINKILQEFALELPENIIINDIDEAGQELLEYRGEEPFYLFKDIESENFQMTINSNLECYYQLKAELTQEEYDIIPDRYDYLKTIYVKNDQGIYQFSQTNADKSEEYKANIVEFNWFKGTISDSFNIIYDDLLDDEEFEGGKNVTGVRFMYRDALSENLYTLTKFEYGDIPGYRMTDLVYAGELKSNAGETITSILDKIKNKFTNFEYYYDVNGKFVFQKKKDYLITSWNSGEQDGNNLYSNAGINNISTQFNFSDSQLITSFANTPKLSNLKNDYSVHGNRDNIALRMRYAIDTKPTEYMPIRVLKEKIVTLVRDEANKIIEQTIQYKYYDAPEIQPYNENSLLSIDDSYKVIELVDSVVNHSDNPKTIFKLAAFENIQKSLNMSILGDEYTTWWYSLFVPDDKNQFEWVGTIDDIKNIIYKFNEVNEIYGNKVQMSIIPTGDGKEVWTIIYPYFAKYPYSTQHVVKKYSSYEFKDTLGVDDEVLHYKVDWRELIYQMALDYRKLNTTNDYFYYLKQANPQFIYNKTGYEQYYIDISLWRDLYNPNPELLFNDTINFKDVKGQSLLLDGNIGNDALDNIYLKNGYRLITPEDEDIINYTNVYQYCTPEDSNIYSIYPFATSERCHLSATGEKYYLEDEINKRVNSAFTVNGEKITANYDDLKNVSTDRIYIKNDEEFYPKDYIDTKVTFTDDKPYEPYKYYTILDYVVATDITNSDFTLNRKIFYEKSSDGTYYESPDNGVQINKAKTYYLAIYELSSEYQAGVQYYELQIRSTAWNEDGLTTSSTSGEPIDFNVLSYPTITTLNSEYEEGASADYLVFAETVFADEKASILDPNVNSSTKNNEEFFIKTSNYTKLLTTDPLWNLYYRSTIYPLSYKSSEILNELESQVNNFNSYKSNSITYLEKINEIFKKYILYLETTNYTSIKDLLFNLLNAEFIAYKENIFNFTSANYLTAFDPAESCLYYIYNDILKTRLDKINFNNEGSLNEQLLNLTNLVKSLNLCIQNAIININLNYNQVSSIESNDTLNKYLDTSPETTPGEKYEILEQIKIQLEGCKNTLAAIKSSYKEGQAKKTQLLIEEILEKIDRLTDIKKENLEDVDSADSFYITDLYNGVIADTTYMIDKIKELRLEVEKIHYFILQSFVWAPNPATFDKPSLISREDMDNNNYTTEEYNNILQQLNDSEYESLFHLNNDTQLYEFIGTEIQRNEIKIIMSRNNHIMYHFFELMRNLKNMFYQDSLETLIPFITFEEFNNYKLFEQLEMELSEIETSDEFKIILNNFEKETSDFQENIVLEDVNNFNEIKGSNQVFYIPIEYYKASYAFNHDSKEGNFWLLDIFENPQLLTFWFDFLEPVSTEMERYSVKAIGTRSKVVNDKDVKAVHYKEIPSIIFKDPDRDDYRILSGYAYINLTSAFANLFAVSSKSKTAKERIEELLYNHSYCSENINISTIPVYMLEPNQKIHIRDDKCNINGEYIINKITVPLSFKKMMNITAVKSISDIV